MLERVLVALLAQGHLLIEGVPGLAKTLTIKTTAGVLGGSFARVQFTPDLVPSDLVGTRIYRAGEGSFDTELGPVFCNFLLADEINRAPAKVQSVMLADATRNPAAHHAAELGEQILFGASPRGPISLVQAARALALIHGRDYVVVEDLRGLAKDAFRHRLVLSYQALAEEVSADTI